MYERGMRLEWPARGWHGTVVDIYGQDPYGYVRLSIDEQRGLNYWAEERSVSFIKDKEIEHDELLRH